MAPLPLFGRRRKWAVTLPEKTRAGRNALTASGMKINQKDGDTMRRLVQPWQTRAFAYYDMIGEIKYASQFYSRSIASLRLFVGKVDEDGEVEEVDNEPDIQAYLERIRDPGGGRTNLLAAYGRLMFLVGETYLFVSENPDTGEEQWEMLSTDELRVTSNGYTRYKAPSLMPENYGEVPDEEFEPVEGSAVAYRLWKRHPRYSMLADSSMQGVLDLCEELVLLTLAVRARTRSRLAGSGILFMSEDFGPPPLEAAGVDEDPLEDPFLEALTEAMTSPIANEGTASAVVPLVIRGSTEAIQNGVKHVQLVDPVQLYPETGLRRECIERIAQGLDLPPEILTGMTDANHWTAWMVDEQTWKAHLQPVAQQLCDDLTSAYLRPALREAGVKNWADYCIDYDAAEIINHPDRTKDAKELYEMRIVGKEAVREAAGFDDDDAMTDEELHEQLGVQIRDASLAVYGIPTVKGGAIEPQAGEIESKSPTGGTEGTPGGTPNAVDKGPPPTQDNGNTPPGENPTPGTVIGDGALHAKILGASDLALWRAREQAGNRLRSYAKRDPEALKLIDGLRPHEIAPALGPERIRQLKAPPAPQLAQGATQLLQDALPLWGIDPTIANLLGERIEKHVALTLYNPTPTPLPQSYDNYVKGLTLK